LTKYSVQTSEAVATAGLCPSAWNTSITKRLLDGASAAVLLALLSPILLVIALLVKCTSSGPVFYSQERVGRHGVLFTLVKFRSMASDVGGPSLTRNQDRRISRLGRLLRKWKLDELPQLINVVLGQMSLVGPRPDLPQYVCQLPLELKQILELSPGVTGAASLRYRHEEYLFSQVAVECLDEFYCSQLLPEKVRLDLEYARHANLLSDLAILFRTVSSLFVKAPVPLVGTGVAEASTIVAEASTIVSAKVSSSRNSS
jgi:lipopolysaccharide/colanic/teichoic acid biosynthesis glycosyltransferase